MNMPDFSLEGKRVIVTGGRRGIGKAIALTFAEAGADVVVCDSVVDDGEREAVTEEIRGLGRQSLAVQADITQKAAVDNLTQRAIDEFGTIDILVNNAGLALKGSLVEQDEEDWDRVVDTNLKGCYLCSQAVSKKMIEQEKGNIINMASIRGIVAAGGRAASYSISKAGVIMLTRVLALELIDYNIRVNAIAPGWVKTKLNESLLSNPEILKQISADIPMGRFGTIDEIANVALFLASDASSYITGQTIVVAGGLVT